MVYHNTVKAHYSHDGYSNDTFRAKRGYKELEVHNPPERRNRDFKPVNYGSAKGMLNYKHSEAWCSLKNLRDLVYEEEHHPIKWAKSFFFGAFLGTAITPFMYAIKPVQYFPFRKL